MLPFREAGAWAPAYSTFIERKATLSPTANLGTCPWTFPLKQTVEQTRALAASRRGAAGLAERLYGVPLSPVGGQGYLPPLASAQPFSCCWHRLYGHFPRRLRAHKTSRRSSHAHRVLMRAHRAGTRFGPLTALRPGVGGRRKSGHGWMERYRLFPPGIPPFVLWPMSNRLEVSIEKV